jgi:hypothetical protein
MHHSRVRRLPLAAPVALENLGPLILGDHPLDLAEEGVCGARAQGTVQEDHLHPGASAFIDQQHLIRILPS